MNGFCFFFLFLFFFFFFFFALFLEFFFLFHFFLFFCFFFFFFFCERASSLLFDWSVYLFLLLIGHLKKLVIGATPSISTVIGQGMLRYDWL